jgi:hypothetical protein
MISFVTLDNIVTDLLKVVRGSKISQSETISRRQLEEWVNEYRAILLKQDLDKGKVPNPDYIQELTGLRLEVVDRTEGAAPTSLHGSFLMRTVLAIPKTIDLNFSSGLMYVGTLDGEEIQLVSEGRSVWQRFKRFTSRAPLAFLRNRHLYINYVTPMQYIAVRGVFEVPTEAGNFANTSADTTTLGYSSPYPIPANMIPVLKEMILSKELGVMIQQPSDNKNDSNNNVSLNASQ